jgi:gamma-glutamyltranspeptidase/glutathione hydrolase
VEDIVDVMKITQSERTWEFLEGLGEEGFSKEFLSSRLGSTTHISVMDSEGWACGVTCSNGEGAGIVIPGTGMHINNMMGEEDLNPHGFHLYPPGRRMPSMMAPTVVLCDERPELVIGSGGSNRIRSALLQTIVNVVDREMEIEQAVYAPRLHFENNIVYTEPDIDITALEGSGLAIARFRERNLFFGGVHGVRRDRQTGALRGGGDPRRGGVTIVV